MKTLKNTLLTIAVLLCSISVSAHDFVVDGIYYSITSSLDLTVEVTCKGEYSISYENEYAGDIVIPESVVYKNKTYSVTSISGAFSGCSSLTSIVIPNSVTNIGDASFSRCIGLTRIIIPKTVTSFGNWAFSSCTSLTSIIIPNSVTSIGSDVFYGCSNLLNIEIPKSLIYIGRFPFSGTGWWNNQPDGLVYMENLLLGYKGKRENVTGVIEINEGTTVIAGGTFEQCSNLASVVIPSSLTSIGENAFFDCKNLKTVINFSDINVSKGSSSNGYIGYYATKVINADEQVGDFFFTTTDGVHSLVGCIGNENDNELVLPENYKGENYKIGSSAFKGRTNLTSVTIPNSVTSIGSAAFYGCTNLNSVTIPNSVTSIGDDAFYGCKNLKTVINFSDINIIKGSSSDGYIGYYATKVINADEQVGDFFFTTTDGVHSLVGYIGNEDNKELVLPENYKGENYKIGSSVFEGCTGLTSITIPNSVTSIGYAAFYGCTNLNSVTIPNSVTSIGDDAFFDCKNLKTVINFSDINVSKGSSSNGYIGYYATKVINADEQVGDFFFTTTDGVHSLVGCIGNENDNELVLPENYKGENYKIGSSTFKGRTNLTSVTIPNSVTSIGSAAFKGCTNLNSVTIPNSVTSIGYDAFYGCTNLNSVTIPNSVTSIGDDAFYGCKNLKTVINFSDINIIKGSSSDGYIGYYATKVINADEQVGDFFFTTTDGIHSLVGYIGNGDDKELLLPENYKGENYKIGSSAFKGHTNLTSVTIPNSVTSIGSAAFKGCTGLANITIGNSVTSIGDYAFSGCTNLTSVTIPNSVISIGSSAFSDCTKLTSVTIGNNVTSIGSSAFSDCIGLISVTIGNSVTSIGSSAFSDCIGLISVTIGNNVTSIGSSAFLGCTGLSYITYEAKSLDLDYFDGLSLKSLTIGSGVRTIIDKIEKRPVKTIWLTNTPPEGYEKVGGMINYVANEEYSSISNTKIYPYLSSMFEVEGVKYVPANMAERTCDAIDCNYDETVDSVNIASTVSFKGITMTVKDVMPYTFYDCDSLRSITLSNQGGIGDYAFYGCNALETANVEIAPASTDAFTFTDWTSTNTSNYSSSSETYEFSVTKDVVLSFDWFLSSGSYYDYLTVTLDGKTILEQRANNNSSYNDTYSETVNRGTHTLIVKYYIDGSYSSYQKQAKVRNIKLDGRSSSETIISQNVFKDCKLLKNIVLGSKVKGLREGVFEGCSSLQNINIPDSMTIIGNRVFSGCSSLTGITIPQSTMEIGNNVFDGCSSLTNVIIEDRTETLSLGSKGASPLFVNCPLDSVYIGGKISYNTSSDKGYSPFYRNTSLRCVVIGDKEEAIYDNEFYGCTALKNVSVGNGVTSIGDWAFSGCSGLDYFAFGKNVKSIGQEAFSDCTNMTQLISHAEVPPICGTQALDDINKWSCTLKVIEGSTAAYQAADQWKDFFFIEDVVSGIEEITTDNIQITAPIYNLQGVQMKEGRENLPAGIYIQGGKKMIVR